MVEGRVPKGYLCDSGISQDVPQSVQVVVECKSIHQVLSASCGQPATLEWPRYEVHLAGLNPDLRITHRHTSKLSSVCIQTSSVTMTWQDACGGRERGLTRADLKEAGKAKVGVL